MKIKFVPVLGLIACSLASTPAPAQTATQNAGANFSAAATTSHSIAAVLQPNYRISKQLDASAMKWELAYLALSAIDSAQTIYCLRRNQCAEGNPLWGKNPSTSKILLSKAGMGLIHFGIFNYINARNPKLAKRFAQASASIQGGVVMLNTRLVF